MPSFSLIVFYAFSAVLLVAALGVVLARNTVHAALLLVVAFVAMAGVWMLLYAEFLAIVLVLVYVGAVMVLFLFVLMMLDTSGGGLRRWRLLPVGVAIIVAVQIGISLYRDSFLQSAQFSPPPEVIGDNTRMLGAVLYTDYVYVFELAAVLLLVAIIAAAALTLRRRKGVKYNDPAEQMRADPARRVRLVNMPPVINKQTASDNPSSADDKDNKTANDNGDKNRENKQ